MGQAIVRELDGEVIAAGRRRAKARGASREFSEDLIRGDRDGR